MASQGSFRSGVEVTDAAGGKPISTPKILAHKSNGVSPRDVRVGSADLVFFDPSIVAQIPATPNSGTPPVAAKAPRVADRTLDPRVAPIGPNMGGMNT